MYVIDVSFYFFELSQSHLTWFAHEFQFYLDARLIFEFCLDFRFVLKFLLYFITRQTIKSSVLVSSFYWILCRASVTILNFSGAPLGELRSKFPIFLDFHDFSYLYDVNLEDGHSTISSPAGSQPLLILRKVLGIRTYEVFPVYERGELTSCNKIGRTV